MRSFFALLLLAMASATVQAAPFTVCVKKVGQHDDDFDAVFRHGPVRLPAGAAFDLGDASRNGGTGLITLSRVVLTKVKACATVEAAAAHSVEWRWTTSPVFGSAQDSYQLYGIVRSGVLSTSFPNDADPIDYAATRGLINGTLRGTTSQTIEVRE